MSDAKEHERIERVIRAMTSTGVPGALIRELILEPLSDDGKREMSRQMTLLGWQFPVTGPIKFQSVARVLPNENRSKLLHKKSKLYRQLQQLRDRLIQRFPGQVADKRMDFHIELCRRRAGNQLLPRAQALQNQDAHMRLFRFGKNAVGIHGPMCDGYGRTHITIGYFPRGVPESFNLRELLLDD